MQNPKLQLLVSTVTRLRRRGHGQALAKVIHKQRSEDVAIVIEHVTPGERKYIIEACPDDSFRADVLAWTDHSITAGILEQIAAEKGVARVAELLQLMDPDDVADIVGLLPEEKQEEFLSALKGKAGEQIQNLLHYDEETAGGIMNPQVFSLHRDILAKDAIAKLQGAERVEMAFYIYVINDAKQLVGVISLRQLVTTHPDTPLHKLMTTEVVSVQPEEEQEEVARLTSHYGFLAIPVVDDSHHLLGIVTIDDVIDVIREEANEDIMLMAGAGADLLEAGSSFSRHIRSRVVWLLASGVAGLLTATVLNFYQMQIQHILPLVFFIPLVLGMGGNVGTQTSTIVVRGLAMGRIDLTQIWRIVGREILVGLSLGMIYGLLVGGISWLWFSGYGEAWTSLELGLVVCLGMLGSMTLAACSGSVIPMLLAKLNIDPAVATGPFVTTSVDVLGILIYLNVAKAVMPV